MTDLTELEREWEIAGKYLEAQKAMEEVLLEEQQERLREEAEANRIAQNPMKEELKKVLEKKERYSSEYLKGGVLEMPFDKVEDINSGMARVFAAAGQKVEPTKTVREQMGNNVVPIGQFRDELRNNEIAFRRIGLLEDYRNPEKRQKEDY